MKYFILASALSGLCVSSTAARADVYPGCTAPVTKSGRHTFYVDPVKGSLAGDGSAAKPWKTLADVVAPANKLIATQQHGPGYTKGTDLGLHDINPTAPIKAGDLILLKSGNHGSPNIFNMYNSDFITVAAAPGQTPIISSLNAGSAGKWIFQGLTFQGMASTATGATVAKVSGAGLVTIGRGWMGPSNDFVFSNNNFSTAASTSGWNNVDWINKPYNMALWSASPCVSITDNHFFNLLNGVAVSAEKTLVQGNLIEKFANDGMDITASNLLIKNNTIINGVNTKADPLHADGIQGWSLMANGAPIPNTNVVIDGNRIVKTGDANVTYLQGISLFDGKWVNLVIQNNVVVTNHWNGISVFGATGAKIINNTVVASNPTKFPTWITINPAKGGVHSSGVTVRNNISQLLTIADTGVTYDHNITAGNITTLVSGKSTVTSTGTVGNANTVMPTITAGFNTVNNTTGTYDLRLRSTSPAVGFGSATLAPTQDIVAKTRTAPVDAGAYVH